MRTKSKYVLGSAMLLMLIALGSDVTLAADQAADRCNDDEDTVGEYHYWGTSGACYTNKSTDAEKERGSHCGTHVSGGDYAHTAC